MSDIAIDIGVYRHNKSRRLYEVLGVALATETDQLMVVYRPLYEADHAMFVRPYDMFIEMVDIDGRSQPRFEKIVN